MAALMQEIPCADQIHMIPFSAVKGDGVEQLRAIIDEIAQDDAEQFPRQEEGSKSTSDVTPGTVPFKNEV